MSKIKSFLLNDYSYYTNNLNITIFDLIHYFNFNDSLLVIEYNNFICKKINWDKIRILDKSKIEIVTIVGGG